MHEHLHLRFTLNCLSYSFMCRVLQILAINKIKVCTYVLYICKYIFEHFLFEVQQSKQIGTSFFSLRRI